MSVAYGKRLSTRELRLPEPLSRGLARSELPQLVSGMVESALRAVPFPIQLCLYVIAVTGVAAASYWLVERPFLSLKARLGGSHRAERAVAGAVPLPLGAK